MSIEGNSEKAASHLHEASTRGLAAVKDATSAVKDATTTAYKNVSSSVSAGYDTVKDKAVVASAKVADSSKQAAMTVDQYVRDNPWESVGVAAAVGFILGVLIIRR
ncbi:MAG: YqjD family protein [Candidatus Methylacidiphilales bacterium]|nr:hypothetical protein [Candidatus Methylacidiphilales bacterium]